MTAPLLVVGGIVGRLRQEGPIIIRFLGRSRAPLAHQVDLPTTDDDIVPDPPVAECGDTLPGVCAGIRGEIHDGTSKDRPWSTRSKSAVGDQALNTRAKRVRHVAPVHQRYLMAGGQQPPGKLVADKAGATNQ
ncbi:MAG: hypothetical protein C5B60_00390 [Chloroflexi bacterium]|nr:MAG: hypothetical protein C5B60_00390 [Chloroflexota bacterium]